MNKIAGISGTDQRTMRKMRASICLSLIACAACGSVKTSQPDAADPDAGGDAAIRGNVQVTVLDPSGTGAPAVGATVVFIDPDGSVVKRAATDTAGTAQADVLPGANVTSIVLNNMSYQIQTVLAVAPGDRIVLGTRNGDSGSAGSFTVTYPALTGATSYVVVHPCGQSSFPAPAAGGPPAPAVLTINPFCRQSTMEIVVIPHNASGAMSSIAKPNVLFVNGGATTITGSYQGLRTLTASYTNINPLITNLGMTRWIPDGFGFDTFQTVAMPGTTAVVSVTGPQGTGGHIDTSVINSRRSPQTLRQTVSGMAATYGLDIGATLLPWLDSASFDATTGKLIVPVNTTGTSTAKPDMVRIAANYRRTDANNVTTSYNWVLFSPDAGDIALPSLPPDLGGLNPTASDTVNVSAIMIEADTVASYAAIRNDLTAAFFLYSGSRPPIGTARLSSTPFRR